MRKKIILSAAALVSALALLGAPAVALARARTLTTLLQIERWTRHGAVWSVLEETNPALGGASDKTVGTAYMTHNAQYTIWRFRFVLKNGSIDTTWHFIERDGKLYPAAMPITGGTGAYANAKGSVDFGTETAAGKPGPSLTVAKWVGVEFHFD